MVKCGDNRMKKEEKIFLISLVATFILLIGIGFQLNQEFRLTGQVVISFSTDYTNCDANITCGFTNWSSGDYYCLNESQTTSGTCFDITNSSLTLDLNGFNITGNKTGVGINSSEDNLSILNGRVLNFTGGIAMVESHNITIYMTDASNNTGNGLTITTTYSNISTSNFNFNGAGIELEDGNNNIFSNIETSNNQQAGIYITHESNNNTFNNIETSNNQLDGLRISDGENNTITNLISNNNRYGFRSLTNNSLENATILNNTLDIYPSCSNNITNITGTGNLPILFYNETTNIINWSNNFSQVILCNADNSTLSNITLTEKNGLFILDSNNVTIESINSSNNYYGLYLNRVTNSSANNMNLSLNEMDGLYTNLANEMLFEYSTFINNSINGINLVSSDNIEIINNNLTYNNNGIKTSNSNLIEIDNNNISINNDYGIFLDGNDATIVDNYISNSDYGIYASGNDNLIENNDIHYATNIGIIIDSYNYNQIANNQIINNDIGINLVSSGWTQVPNNNITNSNSAGIKIDGTSMNNSIKNNKLNNASILDTTSSSYINFLEYSNSDGIIEFTKGTFLQNITTFGDLTFPGNIKIEEALVYLNSTAFTNEDITNSSADITMYLSPKYSEANLLHNDGVCNSTTIPACINTTRLTTKSPVKFNVSAMNGTYEIGGTLIESDDGDDDDDGGSTTYGGDTFNGTMILNDGNNYSKIMQVGDKLAFESSDNKQYLLELTEVSTSSIKLKLDDKTSVVIVNETIKFSAGGDNLYDVQATLTKVSGLNAYLTFFKTNTVITGGVITGDETTTPDTTPDIVNEGETTSTPQNESLIPTWVIILIVIAILVVIGLITYVLVSGKKKNVVSVSKPTTIPRPTTTTPVKPIVPTKPISPTPTGQPKPQTTMIKAMQPQAPTITPQQIIAIKGKIEQLLSEGNTHLGTNEVIKARDIYKQINIEYAKLKEHDEKLYLKITDFANRIKSQILPRY